MATRGVCAPVAFAGDEQLIASDEAHGLGVGGAGGQRLATSIAQPHHFLDVYGMQAALVEIDAQRVDARRVAVVGDGPVAAVWRAVQP